jgi:hypothetical protein
MKRYQTDGFASPEDAINDEIFFSGTFNIVE